MNSIFTVEFSKPDANFHRNRGKKRIALLPRDNLFHNHSRNLSNLPTTQTTMRLPMITHFDKKFVRMATKKKFSTTSLTPFDFRMVTIKSHIRSLSRANASTLKKSPRQLATNNTQHSPNRKQTIQDLHADSLPKFSNRTRSAMIPDLSIPPLPPSLSPIILPSQSHNQQYGHFLAYLRRQSFARQHRKRQEKEGYSNHIEATIRYNLTKPVPSPSSSFLSHSTSNYSFTSMLMPKQSSRISTSLRTLSQTTKTALDDPLLTSSSVLITPRNSVVDDEITSPSIKPSDFYLNDDKLRSDHVHHSTRNKHFRTPIVYI